jgi:hypothetical protein
MKKKILFVIGGVLLVVLILVGAGFVFVKAHRLFDRRIGYSRGIMGRFESRGWGMMNKERGWGKEGAGPAWGIMGRERGWGMMNDERGWGMMDGRPYQFMSGFMGPMHDEMVNAYAEVFGITPADLNSQLKAGKTIWQIGEEKGLTMQEFRTKLEEARTKALDKAVADGVITQQQADWMKQAPQGGSGFWGGFGCWGGLNPTPGGQVNPVPTPTP